MDQRRTTQRAQGATLRAIGFGGQATAWSDFVANLPTRAERTLRLPGDAESQPETGCGSGAGLSVPDGLFDAILIESWAEALGGPEQLLPLLSERLAVGGKLLIEVRNAQSPEVLRATLEERPGTFDPFGSLRYPALALTPGRVLRAAHAAGLWVEECYGLPSRRDSVAEDAFEHLFATGWFAASYAGGPPPARLWLVVTKHAHPPLAGSVLVGSGSSADRARTAAAVGEYLPEGWECVVADAEGIAPHVVVDRAIAQARGDLLWCVPAGSQPPADLFHALWSDCALHPIAPTDSSDTEQPSPAIDGWMLRRIDALRAGPVAARPYATSSVALADWGLRLEALTSGVRAVSMRWNGPSFQSLGSADAVSAEEDLAALATTWSTVEQRSGKAVPQSTPVADTVPWAGREPRVSLVMIAKNEERFLADCLSRAAPAVDEILLVDTGSTDRTVEIAQSFGARVLHQDWADDFSAPRNLGLQAATGDWILALDADEMLDDGAASALRSAVRSPAVSGYHLRFRNIYTDSEPVGVTMVRLFRKLPGIAYEKRIHEQVTPSLTEVGDSMGLVLSEADIVVEHLGYQEDVMRDRQKDERNLRLFRLQMTEEPNDLYSHYKFGDFLRRLPGHRDEALEVLERAFELTLQSPPNSTIPYAGEIAALCALDWLHRDRVELAEERMQTALQRFMPTPNLHYVAANLALHAGRYDEGIRHFETCLGYHGKVLAVGIQTGITSYVAWTGIAQCYIETGRLELAEHVLVQAQRARPDYEPAVLVAARIELQRGRVGPALSRLTEFLQRNPGAVQCCRQVATILSDLGDEARAQRFFARAEELSNQPTDFGERESSAEDPTRSPTECESLPVPTAR